MNTTVKALYLKFASILLILITPAFATKAADPAAILCLHSQIGVTQSGGLVSQWADGTCSNNYAWMTTLSRRPVLIQNAINGRPALRFNGAQSLLLNNAINPSRFTIFIVGKNNMPTENFSMILGPGGRSANNQIRWENGSQLLSVGTGNGMPAIVSSIGNTRVYHLLTLRYDGSTFQVFRNNNLVTNQPLATTGPWTLAQIGAWYSSYFMQGEIAEITVFDTAVPDWYTSYYGTIKMQEYGL